MMPTLPGRERVVVGGAVMSLHLEMSRGLIHEGGELSKYRPFLAYTLWPLSYIVLERIW
jgi:hypothetical protein